MAAPSYEQKLKPLGPAATYQAKLKPISSTPSPESQKPGFFGTIANAAKAGVQKIEEGTQMQSTQPSLVQSAERGLKIASGAADIVSAPLAPVLAPVSKVVQKVADKVSDIPAVQKFALSPAGKTTARVAEDAGNVADIAGAVAGGLMAPKAPKVASAAINAGKAATEAGAEAAKKLTAASEKHIESGIVTRYEKGVKPLLPGKTTPAQASRYKMQVVDAAKVINENKANLSFDDPGTGQPIRGSAPQSLQQFSDAIEQTKRSVFQNYDTLAKQAGNAGLKIDVSPIARELDTVINDKALSITNPRAIEYAAQAKERLLQAGKLDAVTAQDVVQNWNNSLKAFYRNPSYETASNAAIDAMLANKMRTALDEGISGLTGSEYGALKAKYAALKAVEHDVLKATLRDSRKNVKGLIDLTDIFSGGEVVHGILALNPTTIAQGLTAKAIATFYKHLNDPNRAIKKMFQATGKLPAEAKPTRPAMLRLPPADPKETYLNGGKPIKVFPKNTGEYTGSELTVGGTQSVPFVNQASRDRFLPSKKQRLALPPAKAGTIYGEGSKPIPLLPKAKNPRDYIGR